MFHRLNLTPTQHKCRYSNQIFGDPPKELNEAIENLYFIDEFDLNVDELDADKNVWSSRYCNGF